MNSISKYKYRYLINGLFFALIFATPIQAERIKDVASVQGVRINQLIGYGLVVGLDGSGDKDTSYTNQSLKNMLTQLGVTLPPNVNPQSKNVAAVSVSANLPPFAKLGQAIDITVASIGNAKSLRGGSLLLTPLKGADGNIYAMAQGNLLVSGLGAEGKDGSKVTINIPSVGRIPNGATVERVVPSGFQNSNVIVLNLNTSDFTSALRMTQSINKAFGTDTATPMDATSVRVRAPLDPDQKVGFLSMLENLEVDPGEAPAKVIINSRTGTVVVGNHVRVLPVAVSHGNLIVSITESSQVSQPGPLSQGQTVVTPSSTIKVDQENKRMFLFNRATTLDEIVNAINKIGAGPSDVVAILEALKEAGALQAELIVI
ncbi:flagellar P-ring protein [Gammaproteobacteria bacterium]